ncbi:pyridoxamine 5'-phosphate oxidase family protein [Salinibacterium sp. UTAS2018]|uniref:pyridoxamine 5'-phosphate oxidase family protein n=1 Tax=Salinibacterium sp. UTAS2018 TaxID=2508880 RepID=UPI00143DAE7D|nr:pyridoxamine 5'-phosphate oxidase family protein [Salinibacterium sp. UTAS2018]
MSRTNATRMPELMSHEREALDALLDSEIVGNVAYVNDDGSPGLLPTAVARLGDSLIVHGSTGSRWMRLVSGVPAAVSVTSLGGIVVARSAFESSLIYSSAVLFGSFQVLHGDEKSAALDALTEKLIPGRLREVRPNNKKELAATLVLALPIDEWSLRVSDGWPEDTDDDIADDAWAGQVRWGTRAATVVDAPDLRSGIHAPESVRALHDRG